nr:hypothetical protein [Streptomyces graminofaciens]
MSSSTPARFRSTPYAGTVAALRASSSASGPAASRPRRGTANPAVRCRASSAVPSTPTTVPVTVSSTGPPAAPPPSRSASLPAVPIANSRTPPSRWKPSVAVYVTSAVPSTRASRQPPAGMRTYVPVSTYSRTVKGSGSTHSPSVRMSARSRAGSGVTASEETTQVRSPALCSTIRASPSTASWLVTTVPWWSAMNPVPRGRPAGSPTRTRTSSRATRPSSAARRPRTAITDLPVVPLFRR